MRRHAPPDPPRRYLVTGSDTGAGKTVVTALIVRFLRQRGLRVAALKPLCSGSREDARILRQAMGGGTLDAINPWFFRAALTPLLAARLEGITVPLPAVVRHLQAAEKACDRVVVEGAGGLLSPLGPGYDARDLLNAWPAVPVVVVPNRLGAINQTLLVLDALGPHRQAARVALVAPIRHSRATRGNLDLLGERLGPGRLLEIPRFKHPAEPVAPPRLAAALEAWLG